MATSIATLPANIPKLTISKVREDLYNIEGDGGNVGALVTNEGVILIDDKFDQDHDAIVAQVKSVTPPATSHFPRSTIEVSASR